MEAKELRIGNWLVLPSGKQWQITVKDIEQIETWEYDKFPGPQPIHLTEEWLLNFGFEKNRGYWVKDRIWELEYAGGQIFWRDNYTTIYHRDLKYVHQLQNLYFALTGEELIYNERKISQGL